jgi:hypothetical protein
MITTLSKVGTLTDVVKQSLYECKTEHELNALVYTLILSFFSVCFLQYAPLKPEARKTLIGRAIELGLDKVAHEIMCGRTVRFENYINKQEKGDTLLAAQVNDLYTF